jgi:hypothetical protein
MRTKAHRYSASVASATFTAGTPVIGVTGDFDGGFVQANVMVGGLNLGAAGQWMTVQFLVDGVGQAPTTAIYQQATGTATVVAAATLRVPQGRHRISVLWNSSAAPVASATAELSVAELNA